MLLGAEIEDAVDAADAGMDTRGGGVRAGYSDESTQSTQSLESDDRDALNCSGTRYPSGDAKRIAGELAVRRGAGNKTPAMLTASQRPHGANLRFALMREEQVKLDACDVAGRHVATLGDAQRGPGEHDVARDGTPSRGRVSTGVFYAHLATRDRQASATVILVR